MLKLNTITIDGYDGYIIDAMILERDYVIAKGGPTGHIYQRSEFPRFIADAVAKRVEGQYIAYTAAQWERECEKRAVDPEAYDAEFVRIDAAVRARHSNECAAMV